MHQAPSTSTDRLTGLLQQFGEDMTAGVTETRWLPAPLVTWILALIKEFVETFANLAAQLRDGKRPPGSEARDPQGPAERRRHRAPRAQTRNPHPPGRRSGNPALLPGSQG